MLACLIFVVILCEDNFCGFFLNHSFVDCLVGCFVLQRIDPFRVIRRRSKFQKIQFSISMVFVYKQLNAKTILFHTIQFSITTRFSSI